MDLFSFDDDYVRRLREGDRETDAHFYAYFRDLLHAKLRRKLRSQDAVDDVTQEVFLRVLKNLDQLKDGTRLGAFVNSTCNHVLQEYYRQANRTDRLEDQREPSVWIDPAISLDDSRRRILVREVLAELDERDRDILRAVFLEEVDRRQICERYNVDADYLRVLLHRAKALFRAAYLRHTKGCRPRF